MIRTMLALCGALCPQDEAWAIVKLQLLSLNKQSFGEGLPSDELRCLVSLSRRALTV